MFVFVGIFAVSLILRRIIMLIGEYMGNRGETIARLIGRERNARLVGKVLSNASFYGDYPCHRVVNHNGRLAPGFDEQAELLRQEGVVLKDNGHVDLKKYQWKEGI